MDGREPALTRKYGAGPSEIGLILTPVPSAVGGRGRPPRSRRPPRGAVCILLQFGQRGPRPQQIRARLRGLGTVAHPFVSQPRHVSNLSVAPARAAAKPGRGKVVGHSCRRMAEPCDLDTGVPMLLFLLTAREGRVSANRFAGSSSRSPQTRPHVNRTRPAPPYLCVSCCRPATPSEDKTGNSAGV
jgi:hypothetical protein